MSVSHHASRSSIKATPLKRRKTTYPTAAPVQSTEMSPKEVTLRRGTPFVPRSGREALLAQLEEGGRKAALQIVNASGPYLTIDAAAERLGIDEARLLLEIEQGEWLAVGAPYFDALQLPEVQFDGGARISGLSEVLRVFNAADVTEALLFLQAPSPQHDENSPLELLRQGRLDAVLSLARSHGEHGGR